MAKRQPYGSGHIIHCYRPPKLRTLLYIHVLGYVKWTLRGHCSAERVDGHILYSYQKALIVEQYIT